MYSACQNASSIGRVSVSQRWLCSYSKVLPVPSSMISRNRSSSLQSVGARFSSAPRILSVSSWIQYTLKLWCQNRYTRSASAHSSVISSARCSARGGLA